MRCRHCLVLAVLWATPAGAQTVQEGWQLFGSGRFTDGLAAARSALAKDSLNPDLNALAGRSLVALERFDEAVPYLRRTLARPDASPSTRAWSSNDLGLALFARGDLPGARAAFSDAVAMKATRNATVSASGRLRRFGLDTVYDSWPLTETEHLRVRFSPATPAAARAAWVESRERAYRESTRFFGGTPPKKIDILVWGSVDEATRIAAIRMLGFADPVYCTVNTLFGQTAGHEITHVVSYQALHPSIRTGFVNQGLAVAFDGEPVDRLAAARQAVRGTGSRLDLVAFWKADREQPEVVLNPVSGAFVQYLLKNGGRDRLLQLAREQTPEAARRIYGPDFDRLVSGFEREINPN